MSKFSDASTSAARPRLNVHDFNEHEPRELTATAET